MVIEWRRTKPIGRYGIASFTRGVGVGEVRCLATATFAWARFTSRVYTLRSDQPVNSAMSPGLRSILFTSPACSSSEAISSRAYSSSSTDLPATSSSSS